MQLEFAVATDPGLDPHKRVNEDACGQAETAHGWLFVVCDGMGGHAGGKQAGEIALNTVVEQVTNPAYGVGPKDALIGAIEQAARRVFQFGGPANNPQRPGSTCVALLLHDGIAEVAHVGDSRAFVIRSRQIHRLTRDHSYVQELIDQGALTEQQAIGHPDGNKITRALGMTPDVEVEAMPDGFEVMDGDLFLLATDGLTDLAQPHDILKTALAYLKPGGLQSLSNELVALANRRGGHDNITVQVIRVMSAGAKTGITRIEAPHFASPGRTIAAGPAGSLGTTEPGSPALDAPLGGPFSAPSAWSYGPSPSALVPDAPPPQNPLVYVVLVLVAIIGLLVAALVSALFFRT
ncbi:MAG: serine/threonine-protein phosphatase [Myxococcales bacterium]|nr:serine/threonine-protein phosphatase [Myxococcales bacterium]